MTSTPRPNAGRLGLAVTALACVALTITGLGPASATPAASARRGPEPADTSGGLLYRTRRADFTPLHGVPGASITLPNGIDNHGTIAGEYVDADYVPEPGGAAPPGSDHGFIRDRHGTITTITYPSAAYTLAHGINDRGQVVLPDPQPPGYWRWRPDGSRDRRGRSTPPR